MVGNYIGIYFGEIDKFMLLVFYFVKFVLIVEEFWFLYDMS